MNQVKKEIDIDTHLNIIMSKFKYYTLTSSLSVSWYGVEPDSNRHHLVNMIYNIKTNESELNMDMVGYNISAFATSHGLYDEYIISEQQGLMYRNTNSKEDIFVARNQVYYSKLLWSTSNKNLVYGLRLDKNAVDEIDLQTLKNCATRNSYKHPNTYDYMTYIEDLELVDTDKPRLIASTKDSILLFDTASKSLISEIPTKTPVRELSCMSISEHFVSCCDDNHQYIYDLR